MLKNIDDLSLFKSNIPAVFLYVGEFNFDLLVAMNNFEIFKYI
jgi:hypothetical protein